MTTQWADMVLAITDNLAVGNTLAGFVANDVGDNKTFTNGRPLRPIGSQSTTPTAWFAAVPLRTLGRQRCEEFAGAGPYPLLNAAGLADQGIALGKAHVWVQVGTRAAMQAAAASFLSSHGLEVIP